MNESVYKKILVQYARQSFICLDTSKHQQDKDPERQRRRTIVFTKRPFAGYARVMAFSIARFKCN